MNFQLELLINTANILYLFSYMVRDILWLRILTVIVMTPIYWNMGFTALNLLWITLLLLERRPIQLSPEEERLCELVFRTMTPREMMKILKLATWETVDTDECFIDRGSKLDQLIVIYSGKACVEIDGKAVAEILPGQFIGSISYIMEETAPANIVALEPTCYVTWPKTELKKFMDRNSELHTALERTLAIDLARSIQDAWARQPG
jgi:CRP-like cAMP-binding protein